MLWKEQPAPPYPRILPEILPYQVYLFDLDGTLIRSHLEDGKPVHPFDEVVLLPNRVERIKRITDKRGRVGLITNQGGIAFGFQTWRQVQKKLYHATKALGMDNQDGCAQAWIAEGHPKADPPFNSPAHIARRKPAPGMLLEAMTYFGVEPADVLYIGDRPEDQQAAEAAGIDFMWAEDFFTAKVRDDWRMPDYERGRHCEECGEPIQATAYSDNGEISLSIGCNCGCHYRELEWPFRDDDIATVAQIEALGFVFV